MQPRFPARGTPEYFSYLEEWLIKERVDNERQWRLIRGLESDLSGLDPIINIAGVGFGSGRGSGSGSGSGSSACPCDTVAFTKVTLDGYLGGCSAYQGTWNLSPATDLGPVTNCELKATTSSFGTIRVRYTPHTNGDGLGSWSVSISTSSPCVNGYFQDNLSCNPGDLTLTAAGGYSCTLS